MAQCERLQGCPFFNKIEHLPKTAKQLATTYCHGDNRGCARLWAVSAGVRPPDDLFPNEGDRALILITQSGKAPGAFLEALPMKDSHAKS